MVLDRSPTLGCGCGCGCGLVLSMLLFALPLDHDPVPNVQVVRPVHRIDLLVFATIAGELPPIGRSVVDEIIVKLRTLHATTIYHYATTTTCAAAVPRLVLVWNIIWRSTEPYSRTSTRPKTPMLAALAIANL
jgi:hypothetical protein